MALLEVWKTFEETNGSPDDIAKVKGMMPIVTKKRHVDQETGQTVEGKLDVWHFVVKRLMMTCWDSRLGLGLRGRRTRVQPDIV